MSRWKFVDGWSNELCAMPPARVSSCRPRYRMPLGVSLAVVFTSLSYPINFLPSISFTASGVPVMQCVRVVKSVHFDPGPNGLPAFQKLLRTNCTGDGIASTLRYPDSTANPSLYHACKLQKNVFSAADDMPRHRSCGTTGYTRLRYSRSLSSSLNPFLASPECCSTSATISTTSDANSTTGSAYFPALFWGIHRVAVASTTTYSEPNNNVNPPNVYTEFWLYMNDFLVVEEEEGTQSASKRMPWRSMMRLASGASNRHGTALLPSIHRVRHAPSALFVEHLWLPSAATLACVYRVSPGKPTTPVSNESVANG